MLIEVGPNEQVIYEEDLIHEANVRAEKKEKLMKPIRLEVKMELAYDLISEVNADVCRTWPCSPAKDEATEAAMDALRKIMELSRRVNEAYK